MKFLAFLTISAVLALANSLETEDLVKKKPSGTGSLHSVPSLKKGADDLNPAETSIHVSIGGFGGGWGYGGYGGGWGRRYGGFRRGWGVGYGRGYGGGWGW